MHADDGFSLKDLPSGGAAPCALSNAGNGKGAKEEVSLKTHDCAHGTRVIVRADTACNSSKRFVAKCYKTCHPLFIKLSCFFKIKIIRNSNEDAHQ